MFLVLMDSNADRLQGNRLTIGKEGDISLSPLWTFTSPGAKILRLVSKPTDEVVHSQGRVMADRFVLIFLLDCSVSKIMEHFSFKTRTTGLARIKLTLKLTHTQLIQKHTSSRTE